MRILYVTAIKPTSLIGQERFYKKIGSYVEQGVDVAVVCGVNEGESLRLPDGVPSFTVRFKTSRLPFSIIDTMDEIPLPSVHHHDMIVNVRESLNAAFADTIDEAIASFSPDVIVCSHLTLMTSIVLDRAGEIPVAAINHCICVHEFLSDSVQRAIIARNLERLDLVFACYEKQRELFIEEFGISPDKVRVLHGCCDTDIFTSVGHRRLRQADKPKIGLAFNGKITYKKGVHALLEAVELLPCRPGSIDVRLCGRLENSFQRAALDLLLVENPQNVSYLGELDSGQLAEVYRESQVFVLPSFYEELPLSIISALACECKVVVTDLPGLRHWIEENAPGASVFYVAPPRMQGLDEPLKCDLKDYNARLADAIKEAVLAPLTPVDLHHMSWDARANHVITACSEVLGLPLPATASTKEVA